MYYNKKKLAVSVMWVIIGAALFVLELTGVISNPVFSGMGGALATVGVVQIIRNVRYHSNKEYKEKIDVAYTDERNGYIRMKAWSWAGYLFILCSAVASLVLFILKQTVYGQIVSYCMCAVLAFYVIVYMILQRKY